MKWPYTKFSSHTKNRAVKEEFNPNSETLELEGTQIGLRLNIERQITNR